MDELKKILKLTAGTGEELIACGAEISRVEDTMNRIALHYGATKRQIFIISNGVFVNLEKGEEAKNISIRYIQNQNVDLSKLAELNALSRRIEQEDLPLDEALRLYKEIKHKNRAYSKGWAIAASAVGAAAFCYLCGGNLIDCLGALAGGFVVWSILLLLDHFQLSKVLVNIVASACASAVCMVFGLLGWVPHADLAIMGAVVPLIPGVAFTNGIRDIADGDYISGMIRLADALLVFICIAAGVCIAIKIL